MPSFVFLSLLRSGCIFLSLSSLSLSRLRAHSTICVARGLSLAKSGAMGGGARCISNRRRTSNSIPRALEEEWEFTTNLQERSKQAHKHAKREQTRSEKQRQDKDIYASRTRETQTNESVTKKRSETEGTKWKQHTSHPYQTSALYKSME